jgi:hypothetical protein
MSVSTTYITTQPTISYLDEPSKRSKKNELNPHKNACEKFCTCDSTAERCPTNCSEFGDTFILDREFGGSHRSFSFYSCICFPVTLPTNTLFCGTCTLYNVSRNHCAKNKESKNYLC